MGVKPTRHCDIYENVTERTQELKRYLILMREVPEGDELPDDAPPSVELKPAFVRVKDMCPKAAKRCRGFLERATAPPGTREDAGSS